MLKQHPEFLTYLAGGETFIQFLKWVMRSVIVFDLRSVTSHIKETCCIGMQTTLVDVRNLLGSVRTILMDSIALRICIRARERERGRESCKRLRSEGCTCKRICTVYARYRSQWFKMQFAAADSCRSHQGRPEDQAIVATVECNQADVGCLKDGPVTFEYLYNIYIYTFDQPWILSKMSGWYTIQDDTRWYKHMFVHFQVFGFWSSSRLMMLMIWVPGH